MSNVIIKLLSEATKLGKIVITSLHQPSSQQFTFFNKILLLSDGIKIMYGTRAQALQLFAKSDLPVPENFNPVDWFLRQTKISYGKNRELEDKRRVTYLSEMWHLYFREDLPVQTDMVLKLKNIQKAGVGRQIQFILLRLCTNIWKESKGFNLTLYFIIFGLYLGTMFYQLGKDVRLDTMPLVTRALGINVLITSLVYFAAPWVSIGSDTVIRQEVRSGLYNGYIFNLCVYLVEIPLLIFQTIPGYTIMYWMIGLGNNLIKFWWLYALYFLLNWVMLGMGHFLSDLLQSETLFYNIALPMGLIVALFSGILTSIRTLPSNLKPFRYINIIRIIRLTT